MRTVTVMILAGAAALSFAAAPAKHRVDLDQPGAMGALERGNPQHFRRVTGILNLASEIPCHMDNFAKVSRVRFDAFEAKCGLLTQTSDPAKRRLSFVLDDTNYVTVVTMKKTERLVPAR